MSEKTTVVYHSGDFDGIFCREIARRHFGDKAEYIGWNFGDPPIEPIGLGDLVVMDLPLDAPFGFKFTDPKPGIDLRIGDSNSIMWIDHHKSSIDSHPKDLPGYRIDGVAACRLAWQWFEAMKG